MKVLSKEIKAVGAVSGTNVYETAILSLEQIYGLALHYIFTGATLTGSISIYVSSDPVRTSDEVVNWVKISSYDIAVNGATALQYQHNIDALYHKWIKAVYTNATNAGTLKINATTKGV